MIRTYARAHTNTHTRAHTQTHTYAHAQEHALVIHEKCTDFIWICAHAYACCEAGTSPLSTTRAWTASLPDVIAVLTFVLQGFFHRTLPLHHGRTDTKRVMTTGVGGEVAAPPAPTAPAATASGGATGKRASAAAGAHGVGAAVGARRRERTRRAALRGLVALRVLMQ